MKKQILIIISALAFSCVSVPSSTVTLTKEVISEAEGMHNLNIVLVNKLFEEKSQRLNAFIVNQYTPTLIKKYEQLLPDSLDYKKELPKILQSIIPVINRKKDSLQSILTSEQQRIISGLNANYAVYNKATISLQNLINSIAKLRTSEDQAISAIQDLTGNSVDIKKIENSMNGLLITAGTDFGKLLNIEKTINNN